MLDILLASNQKVDHLFGIVALVVGFIVVGLLDCIGYMSIPRYDVVIIILSMANEFTIWYVVGWQSIHNEYFA